jgi:glycosyltransferase involved in cell wall biosynthesis
MPHRLSLPEVTPLILTYNEETNIGRVLDALSWASRIVVIDSGSTDQTLSILARHDAVEVVHRDFDDHTSQWNFGLTQVSTAWVLALDADYVLTDEFVHEMSEAVRRTGVDGYLVPFTYHIGGRPLRASLYPPRLLLFRRSRGHYAQDGHTQSLQLDGVSARMRSRVYHDDRKPIGRWLEGQDRYARLEVGKLAGPNAGRLSLKDRIRRTTFLGPVLAFMYCLFVRGLILDGRAGLYYALQRLYAETLLSLYMYEPEPGRMADESSVNRAI